MWRQRDSAGVAAVYDAKDGAFGYAKDFTDLFGRERSSEVEIIDCNNIFVANCVSISPRYRNFA